VQMAGSVSLMTPHRSFGMLTWQFGKNMSWSGTRGFGIPLHANNVNHISFVFTVRGHAVI
jgi:hypothetical protein